MTMDAAAPVVAVIPAKGRSRRVPHKNVAPLAGVAMFRHSVRVARQVRAIGHVVVSSDDPEILAGAEEEGARPMPRPPHLAGDDVRNFDVLVDLLATLRRLGLAPSILVLLQPTTPFRTAAPLGAMVEALAEDVDADSLITVVPATRPVGRLDDGLWLPDTTPRQRMKSDVARHAVSGHAFLMRPRSTLDAGTLLGSRIRAVPLPEEWLDIDIDLPADLFIAEQVARPFFAR